MFILMIIGTAFLCGINNIYVSYVISPHLGRYVYWMFNSLDTVLGLSGCCILNNMLCQISFNQRQNHFKDKVTA